ncbi:kelch-like protein 17 [Bactrocera dorsalis]|uniref:Kelch-like protein diablo n=1 Tax=Bactrocera dorsalis TaxID=27457 RepID=A0ABM3J8Q8_BACDO|nr:kelch-like protein 17 [Bactrocera dorsalis]XP_049305597.1 kelch-like protein 17 [Bactrocera dorsalis]XP_049305598.1 kelch-like protein 17 [Bactrocera dorsalis]XP_049305599.1 kelch-like protein 17 [Bactrocera dorsalis]
MATSCTQGPTLQSNSTQANRFMEKLMAKIFCFYDEQSLIDVTFKISNSTAVIPAHRLILAAASPYFENLFNGEQGNNPVIEINDIDSDIFERLIAFCYTGQTLITVNNVGAMVKAAIVLQLDDALASCVDYLMIHIGEYTLQGAHTLERETQCELLKQKIVEYEIQNFMEISQSNEFLNFDVERMQRLLESDNLNIAHEEDAFDAIKRWFNYDIPARQEQLPLLIGCLRLIQFDDDFLFTHIQPLPGCELLAFKALLWISKPEVRTKINMRFTEPRGISGTNCGEKTILAVFSWTDPKLLQYNKAEDKWQEFASINYDYRWYRTILRDDNLLFIGGNKNDEPINTVRSWNIRNKTWQNLPVMNQARDEHCVVELDGKIYAIGGHDGKNTMSSMERYTTSDGWKFMNSLIVGRFRASAVTLNSKIYIMGGFNGGNYVKSFECYDPDSNIWTSCGKMKGCHVNSETVAHNGHIYVLSNKGDNCIVERYNPQEDTWSKICSLEVGGGFITSVSLENKLWVIGGISAGKTRVIVYDEVNDSWEQKRSLPEKDITSCFVVPAALLTSK